MPVFPSFMRRMQETSPAMSLFQGGITPRPYEIQDDPPPTKSSADGVRERIAQQLRYEDIAPKLEEVPTAPPFKPRENYGLKNRMLMMLGGAGMGQQRGGGLGALGGAIAGLINPEAVDRAGYAAYRRPQYEANAQSVAARNKQRLEAFKGELEGREAVSKINERTQPEYAQATGAAQTTIYDKKSGRFIPAMIDDEPVEAASVASARVGARSRERIASQNRVAAENKLAEQIAAQIERDESQHGYRMTEIEKRGLIQKAIQRMRDAAASGRQTQKLKAEGYDLGEGTGTGAGTGPARPGGGAGNADTVKKLMDQLKKSGQFLGPIEDDEQDDWWY